MLEEFRRQFESRKDMPAMKPHAPPWSFNPSAVFTRFDAFLRRLNDIEWLFNTVMEFSKLEKIEIGGIQGGSLSARITSVYKEFQNLFVSFTVRANDALEPDDQSFTENCAKFNEVDHGPRQQIGGHTLPSLRRLWKSREHLQGILLSRARV